MTYLGRIVTQSHALYEVLCAENHHSLLAQLCGRLLHQGQKSGDFPCVGDWVELDRAEDAGGMASIVAVRARRTVLSRMEPDASGRTQVMAANVDRIFICMGLDGNWNPRRLERYLAMARGAGIPATAVLTKADLCESAQARKAALEAENPGLEVLLCALTGEEGPNAVRARIAPGETAVLLGSSGVGKSTLINRLLCNPQMRTGAVRADDSRGRHTTTHRQLLPLPGGGALIDTPGMRALELDSSDVDDAFADIKALAVNCRFRDCGHGQEPGCAVQAAVAGGQLSAQRLASYLKLQREQQRRADTRRRRAKH